MKRQHPENPDLFWCPKCETYKAKDEFHNNKNNLFQIGSWCRKCTNLDSHKRYFDNLAKGIRPNGRKARTIRQNGNLWFCPKCKLFKERTEFYEVRPSKSHPHGITGTCKKCCNKTVAAWKSRNKNKTSLYDKRSKERRKDKIKDENIKWRTANKEHIKEYAHKRRIEQPEHIKAMLQSWQKKVKESLADTYIRPILKKLDIPITPETIELKRQQITMKRTLKQFKQWRKENESNHTDVYGE